MNDKLAECYLELKELLYKLNEDKSTINMVDLSDLIFTIENLEKKKGIKYDS